jgi:hypothetical protein
LSLDLIDGDTMIDQGQESSSLCSFDELLGDFLPAMLIVCCKGLAVELEIKAFRLSYLSTR